jgi:dTMP kinase
MKRRGVFISLEGIDYSGKSTQAEILIRRMREAGFSPLFVREPGGTKLSEDIRGLLLRRRGTAMAPRSELMLFVAARAQLVEEVISPALSAGRIVICDRFDDSTVAYQGYGRGLPVEIVVGLNDFATAGVHPDLTLLYDLPVDIALGRRGVSSGSPDRLESEDIEFHERVRAGYIALAESSPDRVVKLDARADVNAVAADSWTVVKRFLENRGFAVTE